MIEDYSSTVVLFIRFSIYSIYILLKSFKTLTILNLSIVYIH